MRLLGVLFSLFLFSFSSSAVQVPDVVCDVLVTNTMVSLEAKSTHEGLCLSDYMLKRDFAFKSLSENQAGATIIINDPEKMYFNDSFLFQVAEAKKNPLEDEGRLAIVQKIVSLFFSELKNKHGSCELKLYSDQKRLMLADFKQFARKAEDLPGTRLMLTRDDVKNPSWELECPNAKNEKEISKSGNYFFLFVDVYQNKAEKRFKGHVAELLFSLN